MRFVVYILLGFAVLASGCATKGDRLSTATLIKLSRLQGRLEGDLAKPCAKDPPPRWCVTLVEASLLFDTIAEASVSGEAVQDDKIQKWLDILMGLARRAAGL